MPRDREADTLQDGPVQMREAVAGGEFEELSARVALPAQPLSGSDRA